MSDYSYNYNTKQFSKAQRAYDNQMPPDDEQSYRECDQCNEEYDCEFDEDGEPEHKICEKCRKLNEEGPQE